MKKGKTVSGRIAVFIAFQLIAMILSGCSKSSSSNTGPGTNEVFIQGYAYNPSSLTVPVNTTVTWINKDPVAHTVTSDTGLFDSGSIASGASYTHQFTAAGTYNYHCTIHPYMTGKIIVQ
ncbi:MAG: cupredoxin family copper-binding protein [Bacteroidales bacterium]